MITATVATAGTVATGVMAMTIMATEGATEAMVSVRLGVMCPFWGLIFLFFLILSSYLSLFPFISFVYVASSSSYFFVFVLFPSHLSLVLSLAILLFLPPFLSSFLLLFSAS